MIIDVLCSSRSHPIWPYLERWQKKRQDVHTSINLTEELSGLSGGDILFLISCSEIVSRVKRARYQACLVIHASDLPHGRGWSPHIWTILEGNDKITLSLLEADDPVDSGNIWKKISFHVRKQALYDEINHELFEAELSLMEFAMDNLQNRRQLAQPQIGDATYFKRRVPEDSRIDPDKPLSSQFDLLRISDPNRYPAFFEFRGQKYKIKLESMEDEI